MSVQHEDNAQAAIRSLEGKDRVGALGEMLSAAGGAAAGVSAAGAVASAAGATTILGSTGLASLLGGVIVAATPVGWVIGSAVLAGAAGYGIARLVRSGARQDEKRKRHIKKLQESIKAQSETRLHSAAIDDVRRVLEESVVAGLIPVADNDRILVQVQAGTLTAESALDRVVRLQEANSSRASS